MKITSVRKALQTVQSGQPVDAFEAAKWLISIRNRIRGDSLAEIASNKGWKPINRVAAIYVIGFLGKNGRETVPTLISILNDQHENTKVRSEAAEALGYIRDQKAIQVLEKIILSSAEPQQIRIQCIFALPRIGGSKALAILKEVERTRPTGKIAKQLKEALSDISRGII
jgi:HEAT repeat protein